MLRYTPKMKQELDILGYTVVHNVVDPDWLGAMRTLIDEIVVKEGDNLGKSLVTSFDPLGLPVYFSGRF